MSLVQWVRTNAVKHAIAGLKHECKGLRDVSGLSGCEQLRSLELGECSGLRDVAALGQCPALSELVLNKLRQPMDSRSRWPKRVAPYHIKWYKNNIVR